MVNPPEFESKARSRGGSARPWCAYLELSLGEDTAERAFVFPKKAVRIDDESAERLGCEWKRQEIEYRHDELIKSSFRDRGLSGTEIHFLLLAVLNVK
jgi:hypothetical protein